MADKFTDLYMNVTEATKEWIEYCDKFRMKYEVRISANDYVVSNKKYRYVCMPKNKVTLIEDSDALKTRVYLLINEKSFYVGITNNIKRRILEHDKEFDTVLWCEDVGATLGPVDASMIERAIYCLSKDYQISNRELLLDDRDETLEISNKGIPSLPAYTQSAPHSKDDYQLYTMVKGLCLQLECRGYKFKKLEESDVQRLMYGWEQNLTKEENRKHKRNRAMRGDLTAASDRNWFCSYMLLLGCFLAFVGAVIASFIILSGAF